MKCELIDTGMIDPLKQNFLSACRENNLTISESQIRLLEKYVFLLLLHNKKLNLISRKDEENVWTRHILHCTSLLFYRKFPPAVNILDLGAGGGLPGIVFAIFHPGLRFTLLDATRKKIEAVKSMVNDLSLENVNTAWGRAEEIGKQPDYAGKFNIVVARAVAPLNKLVKWAKPFLAPLHADIPKSPDSIPVRSLVAFKGGDVIKELKQIEKIKAIKKIGILKLDLIEDEKKVIIAELNTT